MTDAFLLDKIEVRTHNAVSGKGTPKYFVRGTAVVPELEHIYNSITDKKTGKIVKNFKSLFTQNAVDSIAKQFKSKNVFVDALHEIGSVLNSKKRISEIKSKVSDDKLKQMLEDLDADIQMKQLPMFRGLDAKITDTGLEVSVESNPHFAEVDEEHQKYYSAIMNSLVDGFINGMSLNFRTTKFVDDNGVKKIDDVDLYGLSLVPGAALGSATNIAEVAMRSMRRVERDNMTEGNGNQQSNDGQPQQGQSQGNAQQQSQGQPNQAAGQAPSAQNQAQPTGGAQMFSPDQVNDLVQKAVKSAMEQQQQKTQLQQYQEQIQQLQEKLDSQNNQPNQSQQQSNDSGSRGFATNPGAPGQQAKPITKEMLENLSYVDLMRLQGEFPDKAQGQYAKVAEYVGRAGDPRATTKVVKLPKEMEQLHRTLMRAKEDNGLRFTGLPTQ